MKSSWKRFLALFLIAAMILPFGASGFAADDGDDEIVIIDPEEVAAAEEQLEARAMAAFHEQRGKAKIPRRDGRHEARRAAADDD